MVATKLFFLRAVFGWSGASVGSSDATGSLGDPGIGGNRSSALAGGVSSGAG